MMMGCLAAALLGFSGAASAGPPCPCPDEIQLTKGDQYVIIEWDDPPDSQLFSTELDDDGWSGFASPTAWGYKGNCDNEWALSFAVSGGEVQVVATNAMTGTDTVFTMSSPGVVHPLDDNIMFQLASSAVIDDEGWGDNAEPSLDGYFVMADSGLYTVTAVNSGTVGTTQGETPQPLQMNWEESVGGSNGTLTITRGDSLFEFDNGLMIAFSTGDIAADSTFVVRAWRDVVDAEQLEVLGFAFGGYKVWRSDVNDLDEPRLIGKLTLCNPADSVFFRCDNRFFVDGVDPWYQDETCSGQIMRDTHGAIRITGDVTNAFPYWYGVTTFDTEDDLTTIDYDPLEGEGSYWKKTYPSEPPRTNVSDIRVIPNPYNVREEWEEGESRITFDNLPGEATIYVYNVIGELVIQLDHSSPTDDFIEWNLKSGTGRDVVSGVYLYKVESSAGDKVGKFIVIR
jgi:hypothetical protein